MDLQTYRETSLRIWDEMDPGWEDRREWILGVTGAINEWLAGQVDPHQVGAFLMLLRFRGEDAEEIAGMVQAVRAHAALGWGDLGVDLDWPSYGAGRTRGAPWFLLAALALAAIASAQPQPIKGRSHL